MKLKSNKLILLVLLFFILVSFSCSCFAASDLPSINEIDLSTYSGYDKSHYIIYNTDEYKIVVFPTDFTGTIYQTGSLYSEPRTDFLFFYKNGGDTWQSMIVSQWDNNSAVPSFSTDSLYSSDDSLFFQRTPLTLKQIVEVEGEKQTIQKTLLGLVPLLIGLVVSLMGLRKALVLLRHRLVNS